jgi:hypothetical protein
LFKEYAEKAPSSQGEILDTIDALYRKITGENFTELQKSQMQMKLMKKYAKHYL